MALALILAIFSLMIVLGEVLLSTSWLEGLFYYLLAEHNSYLKVQIFCVIPILFMSSAVFYSLFKLKISGFLGLYNH